MRTVNVDWGERVPKLHFVLDQERLQLIGLSPKEAAQQLQFLLNGQTITQVRENIRAVNVVARSAGPERLDQQIGKFHPHDPEWKADPFEPDRTGRNPTRRSTHQAAGPRSHHHRAG